MADPGFLSKEMADPTEQYQNNRRQSGLRDSFDHFLNFKLKCPQRGGWLATDAIHPSSPPESATEHVYHNDALVQMLEPPTLPNFYER